MKIGLIARSDRTGLGNQTRNLARLLNPDKVMLIDSSSFNGNEQHPETYKDYQVTTINGFPDDLQVHEFLRGLDVAITCEIFYNNNFVDIAKELGVKTINHYNWEFADYLRNPYLTVPDVMVSPSKWMYEESRRIWGGRVKYLPTPVFTDDFEEVREHNLARTGKKRFLHVAGRQAAHDRNGTQDIIKALQYSREDFELVIKQQSGGLTSNLVDPRITVDTSSPENEVDLYKDFDAMILPRKYAGQCLPMTEALCAGLPVIMTDISPNNRILPAYWLVEAVQTASFMARTNVSVFSALPDSLAARIDQFASKDLQGYKNEAYNIGYREYSDKNLKEQWEQLLEDTCRW